MTEITLNLTKGNASRWARTIVETGRKSGVAIPHQAALEMIARIAGYDRYNDLAPVLKPACGRKTKTQPESTSLDLVLQVRPAGDDVAVRVAEKAEIETDHRTPDQYASVFHPVMLADAGHVVVTLFDTMDAAREHDFLCTMSRQESGVLTYADEIGGVAMVVAQCVYDDASWEELATVTDGVEIIDRRTDPSRTVRIINASCPRIEAVCDDFDNVDITDDVTRLDAQRLSKLIETWDERHVEDGDGWPFTNEGEEAKWTTVEHGGCFYLMFAKNLQRVYGTDLAPAIVDTVNAAFKATR